MRTLSRNALWGICSKRAPLKELITLLIWVPFLASAEGLAELIPESAPRSVLARQHYTKRGYAVLTGPAYNALFMYPKTVIVDTVIIPEESTVVLEQNQTIFFEPGAVLLVHGRLEAAGTVPAPVHLAPIPKADMLYKPGIESDQWDGIVVSKSGSLDLNNVTIEQSRTGVVSLAKCSAIQLRSVSFTPPPADGRIVVGAAQIDLTTPTPFTLDCAPFEPLSAAIVKRERLSSVFVLSGAGFILGAAAMQVLGAITDRKVADATSRSQAQLYHDRASGLFWAARGCAAGGAALLIPGVSLKFQLKSGNRGKN